MFLSLMYAKTHLCKRELVRRRFVVQLPHMKRTIVIISVALV